MTKQNKSTKCSKNGLKNGENSVKKWKNEKGEFIKGWPGGPGRGHTKDGVKKIINETKQALYEEHEKHGKDIEKVVKKLYALAKKGDMRAIEFLLAHFMEPKETLIKLDADVGPKLPIDPETKKQLLMRELERLEEDE